MTYACVYADSSTDLRDICAILAITDATPDEVCPGNNRALFYHTRGRIVEHETEIDWIP